MKTYLLKITKEEKMIIDSVLNQGIELCKEAIHDNIYFKDEEGIKSCTQELKEIREVLWKIRSVK